MNAMKNNCQTIKLKPVDLRTTNWNLIFPLTITANMEHTFKNHKELYNFYYSCPVDYLRTFAMPFWKMGINLITLVHHPEKFTLNN